MPERQIRNRTIMIHIVDGPIFCIGESVFIELITIGASDLQTTLLAAEMGVKLIDHLELDSP